MNGKINWFREKNLSSNEPISKNDYNNIKSEFGIVNNKKGKLETYG